MFGRLSDLAVMEVRFSDAAFDGDEFFLDLATEQAAIYGVNPTYLAEQYGVDLGKSS